MYVCVCGGGVRALFTVCVSLHGVYVCVCVCVLVCVCVRVYVYVCVCVRAWARHCLLMHHMLSVVTVYSFQGAFAKNSVENKA